MLCGGVRAVVANEYNEGGRAVPESLTNDEVFQMNRMFSLLLVSLLFISSIADAALIRGGGFGSSTSSEAQNFYRIANDQLDALGVKPSFSFTDRETLISGQIPLFAVPTDCYVDISFPPPGFVNDPCYYQFFQNELLQFEGYMAMFFPSATQMDLVWTLTGAGYHQSFAGSNLDRTALLDTVMPALDAGEYQISLMVKFYAGAGYQFYRDPSVHSDDLNCGELNPGDENSFSCSYNWAGSDFLSFSSYSERVLILAGDKPVDIPAPGTSMLLLLGGSLLCRRICKQK
jgi:hypothetical protein